MVSCQQVRGGFRATVLACLTTPRLGDSCKLSRGCRRPDVLQKLSKLLYGS